MKNKLEVFVITGNTGKILAARKAFSAFGVSVKQIDKEYPEIQASSIEVARNIALRVVKEFNAPAVKEDHSLFIHALKCFPCLYSNYFNKNMPVELLLKVLSGFEDRLAHMELAACLALPSGEVFESIYTVPLSISRTARGKKIRNRSWDMVLMLQDDDKTFAEEDETHRIDVWTKNYENLARVLLERHKTSGEQST